MSEYLIQGETMAILADNARRFSDTADKMNAAEILEIISRTQGIAKTEGKYLVQAKESSNHGSIEYKSGYYDTGEIFALPDLPIIPESDVSKSKADCWTSNAPIKNNYIVIDNYPVVAFPVYCDRYDDFYIYLDNIGEGTEIGFSLITISDVKIDWGDGTVESFPPNYNFWNIKHTYTMETRNYEIRISGNLKYPQDSMIYTLVNSDIMRSYVGLVRIPKSMTYIRSYYFRNFTSLRNATIPNGIISIDRSAFEGCTNLSELVLPSSLTSIGASAFKDCTNLSELVLPSSLTSIGASAFEGCTNLSELILPKGLTNISDHAFYRCGNLTKVIIPEGVVSIEGFAFGVGASDLEQNAFNEYLSELILPSSLTSIGEFAFYWRTIHTLVLYAEEVVTYGGCLDSFFQNIYVPDNLVDEYKSSEYWSRYINNIKPISQFNNS